jgi:hypothetical protein
VAFSLATFFFPQKRKYARRSTAEPSGSATTNARASGAESSASNSKTAVELVTYKNFGLSLFIHW